MRRASRWLRPALLAGIAGMLVVAGVEFGLRSLPKADDHALRAHSDHITELLAKDAYAEAAQDVMQLEHELKVGEKDVPADALNTVAKQYELLDQWLERKYGRLNSTEHDIIHSLLLAFSANESFQIVAIHLDEKKLVLTVDRTDDAAISAESVAIKNPPEVLAPEQGGAGGRSLHNAVQSQSPLDSDTQALTTYILRHFPAVDDVELTWRSASEKRTLQVQERPRTEGDSLQR